VIAFLYIAMFLWGLADTWGDAVRMVVIAAAIAVALTLLPALRTLVEPTYPDQARIMHGAWLALIAVAFFGVMSYGLTASPQYEARWRPGTYLPQTQIIQAGTINQAIARRLLMLMVSFGTVAGAGMMLRWSMLGSAESYRLAYGEAGPAQKTQAVAPQANGAAMMTPGDVFGGWAAYSLREKPGAKIQAELAYNHYEQACQLNGVEPMSIKKFGDMLTRKAELSNGRFIKTKIGGKIYYQGWELPDAGNVMDVEYQQIEGPR
jgi:hypothetical protein